MNKDVKKALLLWPAIASTAIIAATTLPMLWNHATPSFRSMATSSSTIGQVVRWSGAWLHRNTEAHVFAESTVDETCLIAEQSPMTISLRSFETVVHRPDHGVRGLAIPARLKNIDGFHGQADSGALAKPAELAASDKNTARTLLAPVLDPVAELAGYSGPVINAPGNHALGNHALGNHAPSNQESDVSIELSQWNSQDSVVLPSTLSPGLADPFDVSGASAVVQLDADQWMASLDPTRSWEAVAVNHQMSNSPNLLNRLDEFAGDSRSLIPESVKYLARPSFDQVDNGLTVPSPALKVPTRPLKIVGNAWPQPKQLCRDLAVIAADADVARLVMPGQSSTLVSLDLNASNSTREMRELVSAGSLQQVNGKLVTPLQRQATSIVMGRWADRVEATIDELQSLPRIADDRSGVLIRRLASLSEAGLRLAERVPAREQQVRWLRAAHACSRRSAVWGPVWKLASQGQSTSIGSVDSNDQQFLALAYLDNDSNGSTVADAVSLIRSELHETGDESGWDSFLLLNEIEAASQTSDTDARALVAQRFLSRLDHHLLTVEHRFWLERDSVAELAKRLQVWTVRPIDYTEFLQDLERGESDSIDLSAIKVGEAFQSLRFSDDVDAATVAKAIDLNYRNANVRTAISVRLIDRLIPTVPSRDSPIQTTILGNAVRGTSHVDSQLGVRLTPSLDSWNLDITTNGHVSTQSRSGQSGVTVMSSGSSVFGATTPLIIRRNGYTIGATQVDVTGNQRLSGIRSKYDGWPLVGSLVRGLAESRFQDAKPVASRVSRNQIQNEVSSEVQTQLSTQVERGASQLDEFVFGPLGRLDLQPKIIDLKTTPTRLVARYRLAGDWQLASNTPRPRAWNDSWLSLQVHQSALNNTMEQLLPTGNAKTFGEFFNDTLDLFGRDGVTLPEDIPADAVIEFAGTRPITIEMDEGKLVLTLRVVKLEQPDSARLSRFIVRATYRPEIDGLKARLVRDGHLSVTGPGMSMRKRFPIRALFNKVLSESRAIPLTLPKLTDHPATQGLAISQLELRDGWLALAISPNQSARIAVGTRPRVASQAVTR